MSTTPATGQVATAAVNEVTGARLVSRAPTDAYRTGWDLIFGLPLTVPANVRTIDCGDHVEYALDHEGADHD